MYLDFFGLREKPFNTTPDPKFLYLTEAHREALARLLFGVQEGQGFTVLIGEVGTGKTTLLHTLLQRVPGHAAVAFVSNSTLPFDGLLEYMLEDFGVKNHGTSTAQRLAALNRFLIERRRQGQCAILILDEAQNLSPGTLEQIRLLSNFEIPEGKLLQILMVGQPELQPILARPELRQLRQRIGIQCSIRPLTEEETTEYVRSRLRVAGAADLDLFDETVLRRIARSTGGIPRVINTVCNHCLLIAYGEQTRRIGPDIVERALGELELGRPGGRARASHPRPAPALSPWAWGGIGAAAAAGVAVLALEVGGPENVANLLGGVIHLAREARALVLR